MKTLTFLLFAVLLISSCKSSRITTQVVTETEYMDTTLYVKVPVYIDTTIFVSIPNFKDSIIIRDSIRVVDGKAYMKAVHKQIGIIGVDVSVTNSKIEVSAYLTDSTIQFKYIDTLSYGDSIKIHNAIKDKITTSTIVLPPEKYVPGFHKFTMWFFIILVVLGLLFVAYKILRIRGLLPFVILLFINLIH